MNLLSGVNSYESTAWTSSNSMSMGICDFLKWNAPSWTLNTDQMPADKDNYRKADLCVDLAVGNCFHTEPKGIGNSSALCELISKYVTEGESATGKIYSKKTATLFTKNNGKKPCLLV